MLIYPLESPAGRVVIVMILERENLDRMKEGDPIDYAFSVLGKAAVLKRPISSLELIVGYEEDINQIIEFQKQGDVEGFLKWLQRGRRILPGDLHTPFPLRKT